MKIHAIYANTELERKAITPQITERKQANLTAALINYKSDMPLNKFFAIEILLDTQGITEFTAISRHSEYWCKPVFCKSASDIPENTQCLLWQGGCLLPVCDKEYLSMISGTEYGYIKITLNTFCGNIYKCDTLAYVLGTGKDTYKLIKDCTEFALEIMCSDIPLREQREYPQIFKYLGWCSWDAFMTGVSEKKLIQKCTEFKKKNIPVKWALIDDMWADCPGLDESVNKERKEMIAIMHKCKLNSFKADAKRFPDGLEGCIKKLHEMGIKVGIWHPTTGYWGGITENGEIDKTIHKALIHSQKYSSRRNDYSKEKYLIHAPDYKSAYTFYNSFHRYLKKCGADFVKVDNQSFTHMYYHDILPIGTAAKNIHKAIDRSALKHFNGALINCMGASSENMWNRPSSSITRCCDDFLPENRDWFTKHILQCAFNSMIQGVFYVCDWDMWWTDDSQAVKNSVLRAISGGPIYISDMLGRSRQEILSPLCLSDGRILICDHPAVPLEKCVYSDPEINKHPFMLQNTADGRIYVAAFNLDKDNNIVKDTLSVDDTNHTEQNSFVLYEYFNKTAKIINTNEKTDIELTDRDDFRLYSIIPKRNITFIGLIDKMIPSRTIESETESSVILKEGGKLAFVSENDINAVFSNGMQVPFEKSGILYTVNVEGGEITVK